jgi:hypothetical protein
MKNILLFILGFYTIVSNGQQSNGFEILGKITNANGKQIYLTKRGYLLSNLSKVVPLDSCLVTNGSFQFRGQVNEQNYYSLFVKGCKGWKPFILDNTKLEFIGNADSIYDAKVIGSRENVLSDSLNLSLKV